MKTILTISGGGCRGIIPATFWRVIAPYFQESLPDLIAGTSTGAIIASLIASPRNLHPADIVNAYYDLGPKVFRRGFLSKTRSLFGAKYDIRNLSKALAFSVGEYGFDEARTKLLIPTVNADTVDAVFLKSWDAAYKDWYLWEAATASSAAQTFFDAYKAHNWNRYIDGGNHSNCPVASALFEAARLWPDEEIRLIHFGTGRQLTPDPLPDGGLVAWAPLVFGTCSETQEDICRYFVKQSGVKNLWLDLCLDKFPPMDDASKGTLDELSAKASSLINSRTKEIEDFFK